MSLLKYDGKLYVSIQRFCVLNLNKNKLGTGAYKMSEKCHHCHAMVIVYMQAK